MKKIILAALLLALTACSGAGDAGDPCSVTEHADVVVPDGYPYRFGTLSCGSQFVAHCSTDPRSMDGVTYIYWGEWACWSR